MIALVFTACLMSSPTECGERVYAITAEAPAAEACALAAPVVIDAWNERNPEWLVIRWKCDADADVDVAALR